MRAKPSSYSMFQILKFNRKGFTLVEIIVVLAIMAVLSTLIFNNYSRSKQQLALQRSAAKLAQDIGRIRQRAISTKQCPECGGPAPKTGYGIFLDATSGKNENYLLYADTSGENEFYTAADTVLETIELEKGIIIYKINVSPPNNVSINFKPPEPEIKIKYSGVEQNKIDITLCIEGTACGLGDTKVIETNTAGLINIQ